MAFKLRSGNGPLQFKNMGATPVKQTEEEKSVVQPSMTQKEYEEAIKKQKLIENLENLKGTPEYKAKQERIAEEKKQKENERLAREEEKKAKIDATRGTHEGQIKKQAKLDKIQSRQDRNWNKKADKLYDKVEEKEEKIGELESKLRGAKKGSWNQKRLMKKIEKQNKKLTELKGKRDKMDEQGIISPKETRREKRLKKEVAMTPEEFEANEAEKRQRYQDAMNRLAMIVHPDFDPRQVAQFDEQIRTRGQREESTRINDAYKAAETARINNALNATNAYHLKQQETDQDLLSTTNPVSTKNDGTINDESTDE
jgi:hypothetical protein